MRRTITLLCYSLAWIGAVLGCLAAEPQLQLEITLEQSEYIVGEPIAITSVLSNLGNEDLIHEAGIRELTASRQFIRLTKPLSVEHNGRRVAAYPSDSLRVSYTINFNHPLLRHQEHTLEINESSFTEEIAPARTFGFQKDVEVLRQNGLALGGSLDNAIVLSETGVLNNPLRFPDEFVRHKILDILGDLSLLNRHLLAHVVAVRAGHGLHTELVQEILTSPNNWELVTLPEPAGASVSAAEAPSFAEASATPRH